MFGSKVPPKSGLEVPSGEALPRLCFNQASGPGISSFLWQKTKATNIQRSSID